MARQTVLTLSLEHYPIVDELNLVQLMQSRMNTQLKVEEQEILIQKLFSQFQYFLISLIDYPLLDIIEITIPNISLTKNYYYNRNAVNLILKNYIFHKLFQNDYTPFNQLSQELICLILFYKTKMNKKSLPLRKRANINQIEKKKQLKQIKSKKTLSRNVTVTEIQPQIKSQYSEGGKRKKLPQGMKQFLKSKKIQAQLKNQLSETQSLKQNPENIKKFDETIQIIQLQQVQDKKIQDENVQNLQRGNIKITRYDVSSPRKPFNKQNIICQICEGETELKDQILAFKCLHKYCRNCLQSYVSYKISLFEEVRCPDESCENTLDMKCEFYDSLKKKQRKNYKKIHNFQQTKKQKDLKLCPKEDCDGIIKVKQNQKSQICEICKTLFCSECYFPLHEGACKQYEVLYLQNNLHYRQCQKCKAVVQRIQGCNHITCKCSYQFCYMCGKKWKHDHICNQKQFNDEDGCDFGQSCFQHFCFLIKLPFKIVLIIIYTIMFFIMSFAAAPYNLIFFTYWLGLIFFGGPCVFYQQEQRTWWQFILFFIFFPILMILCIPKGIRLFARKFSEECQCVSSGYRWIVNL